VSAGRYDEEKMREVHSLNNVHFPSELDSLQSLPNRDKLQNKIYVYDTNIDNNMMCSQVENWMNINGENDRLRSALSICP